MRLWMPVGKPAHARSPVHSTCTHGLVTDGEAVVPGWDVEDVARAELGRRAVGELDPEAPGDDEPDVPRLAPLAADDGLHVRRPAPARLVDHAPDGEVAEVDDLDVDLRERR